MRRLIAIALVIAGCKDEPPAPPAPATQYWPGQDLKVPSRLPDTFTPATGVPAYKGKDLQSEVTRLEGEIQKLHKHATRTPSQARVKEIQGRIANLQQQLDAVKAEIARREQQP